ncbi:hypothetical protein B0A49_01564 [Cryomyces minteri]|uniref:Uncharacterized protein n=1 Tax=Cryomyces minteri TaxID=331657 RepID=A0A4U0XKK1_9PEZI|nr:hypothetical protein B0A49_01564 [Cryomyces minteri]
MSSPNSSPPEVKLPFREEGSSSRGRKRSHDDLASPAEPASPSLDPLQMTAQESSDTLPSNNSSTPWDQQPSTPLTSRGQMLPPPPIRNTSNEAPRTELSGSGEQGEDTEAVETTDEDADPSEPIAPFDWKNLENKYHDKIRERAAEEQRIYDEFGKLITYFNVWSSTTSRHEVERSFKRLKTQMAYVNHSEDVLEQKRQHYLKVVAAFQSALALLNQ